MIQIKNMDQSEEIILYSIGKRLAPDETYNLSQEQATICGYDDDVLAAIAAGLVKILINNEAIQSVSDQISTIRGTSLEIYKLPSSPPFTSKVLPDGSKLYRRKHGFQFEVAANSSYEMVLTNPYAKAKINELEIVNCIIGDAADLKVYDTVSGLYQQSIGVPAGSVNPDLMLNQFGFGVFLPDGFYKDICTYDAELIGGMRVKLTYYNNTANAVTKYGNIVFHEVV